MTETDVVILAGSRTPQGRVNGQLSSLTAVDLGTAAIVGARRADQLDGIVGAAALELSDEDVAVLEL